MTIISSGTSRNDGSKLPRDADRVLAEVDDLREQRVVGADAQAGLALEPLDLGEHLGPARLGIDDRRARRAAPRRTCRRSRSRSSPCDEEAMAAALAAGGLAGPRQRHDLAAEQRDEPLHRAHEADLAPAPAHATSATGCPRRARAAAPAAARASRRRRRGARRPTYRPFLPGDFLLARAATASTPFFAAKPCPALVSEPSGANAARHRRADDLLVADRAGDRRGP